MRGHPCRWKRGGAVEINVIGDGVDMTRWHGAEFCMTTRCVESDHTQFAIDVTSIGEARCRADGAEGWINHDTVTEPPLALLFGAPS